MFPMSVIKNSSQDGVQQCPVARPDFKPLDFQWTVAASVVMGISSRQGVPVVVSTLGSQLRRTSTLRLLPSGPRRIRSREGNNPLFRERSSAADLLGQSFIVDSRVFCLVEATAHQR